MKDQPAVILFSGGLDSTTALCWALEHFSPVLPIMFDYSQRHKVEITLAEKTLSRLRLTGLTIPLPLNHILRSALLDPQQELPASLAHARQTPGPPSTYVPFRNGIFLSIAAACAESRNISHLITGFNQVDSPDYPDTTRAFTEKMTAAINEGSSAKTSRRPFTIHTPLIDKTKQEIIQMGVQLNADYSWSVSCYGGDEIPCLRCPSCDIRQNAFAALGMEDPLVSRLKKEGKL